MTVVCDSTPLIALSKINRLDLLQDLFGTIHVPQAVYEEVVVRAPDRPGAAQVGKADWIQVQTAAYRDKINYLRGDLDSGEAEFWFWPGSWEPTGLCLTKQELAWLLNSSN